MSIPKHQQGFSLLEALLALFVLSVGTLGVAGLQTQGMRSSGVANQRTLVVMKTQEIIERMRSNQDSLLAYAGTAAPGPCNTGTFCDGATLAAHDLSVWQGDLNQILPSVTATQITVTPSATAGNPSIVTVTTIWIDRTDAGQTYTVTVSI